MENQLNNQLSLIDTETEETKLLYISTKASQCILLNGDKKSNVLYNIGGTIDFDDDNITRVMVSIPYASLVNSVYQMDERNNMLVYTIGGGGINYLYFNKGNYNQSTFITEFKRVMPPTFSIEFDPPTCTFNVYNSTYPFTFEDDSTIDGVMGFTYRLDSVYDSIKGRYVMDLPRCCNFSPPPIFFITTNTIHSGQSLGKDSQPLFSNIIAAIPNTANNFQTIVYQNPLEEFELKSRYHTQINLGIVDDNGAYVDFNGISSFFCLRFKIYRKFTKIGGTFSQMAARATLRNLEKADTEGMQY